jgi:hypothetical protein
VARLTWEAPHLLENSAEETGDPQIAVDAAGNALVVWDQNNAFIYANRYRAATGTWDASAQLIGNNAGALTIPQVAVDAQGNGICVWEGSDNIQYAVYNAGAGTWGAVQSLTSTTQPVINTEPAVAMDSNGNAIVVWIEWSMASDDVSIKALHYPAGGPWSSIVTLQTTTYPGSYLMPQPRVAMDAQGNALAVWLHTSATDTSYHVYASRYTALNTTWDQAAAIETNPDDASYPRLAMNPAGEAIVVWRNVTNATGLGVYANRYAPSAGWLPAEELVSLQTLTTGSNPILVLAAEVDCAINAGGDSMIAYGDFDGTDGTVYAKRHTAASGWSAGQKIDGLTGAMFFPQVAVAGSGNAVALWAEAEGIVLNIASNNYVPGQGWSVAQRVEASAGEIALNPWWRVAMDGSGNAFAAWIQRGGTNNSWSVYASRGH